MHWIRKQECELLLKYLREKTKDWVRYPAGYDPTQELAKYDIYVDCANAIEDLLKEEI